jgi:aspartate/tyrosine/aromatic aminotransferase
LKCFGVHEVINICPFNKQQRDEYINQSVAVYKTLKGKITDFETFDTAQEYIEVLEQQESLKELAQVPSTLSMILAILPKIKDELKKNNQSSPKLLTQKFSRYQIYQIFEQQFT